MKMVLGLVDAVHAIDVEEVFSIWHLPDRSEQVNCCIITYSETEHALMQYIAPVFFQMSYQELDKLGLDHLHLGFPEKAKLIYKTGYWVMPYYKREAILSREQWPLAQIEFDDSVEDDPHPNPDYDYFVVVNDPLLGRTRVGCTYQEYLQVNNNWVSKYTTPPF